MMVVAVLTLIGRLDRLLPMLLVFDTSDRPLLETGPELIEVVVD